MASNDPVGDQASLDRTKRAKFAKVKNKTPAPIQITAEQILREAKNRELEVAPVAPTQKITNLAELRDFQLRKRKDYEDNIRKNRLAMQNWIKYAKFEESQGELQRARSIFERALDVDFRNIGLWLKYADMEMRNKQVNHARNLWDRAVTLIPRANQFWYKYTYMEELLGNIAGARQVFERWMEWEPEEQAWHAYINFELRYKELQRARLIYERFVLVNPEPKNWVKYAKFEERNGYINSARKVFERAVGFYGSDNPQARLLIEFARFEERQKEHDRARVIYKYALDNLPSNECPEIYKAFTLHEKKYGDRLAIEGVILNKRKFQYESEVEANPHNYDVWFDYVRLMEEEGSVEQTRELYERAVANFPPIKEKRYWRRYIYLWINYALYEELVVGDVERTREVYNFALRLIPHRKFTFAKMWLYAAKFEIRQKQLTSARKLLGSALGKCPKAKLFRGYIELEIQLREFDRCRKLYGKFLEFSSESCTTWMRYAEMEALLDEVERARAIYELAISQPLLDMPEILWKAYIDYEIEQREWDRARVLYRRLMEKTNHVKVWLSMANFELCAQNSVAEEEENERFSGATTVANEQEARAAIERARAVYREANVALCKANEKEQRVQLIEEWKTFEEEYGDEETQKEVAGFEPQRVVRSRRVEEGGAGSGWEEYVEYIFPDTAAEQPNRKLLAFANKWAMLHEHSDDDDEEEQEVEENSKYVTADENGVPSNADRSTNAVATETASMNGIHYTPGN
ncbi:Crooked neck-like protein 1 [Echinococcus granulosus]|uniref:Crooked neck pre mRNA splicing factor 1 n=1 Tax=Echinococcus granulosus TaxID=6210 RepID=U6IWC9_ECHGR|nr:Crooked neck-like protein [Echinococcus granulosus]EUB63860.1 Crooked neck-like protein [Echinococcus granulosus]KAH9285660.1 Crooked neck-like protein 1 [Echinococcus granulosus]CDS16036.1 crooked neck pre mRNA splicing factor 1 [Echinococcus granulosus]